MCETLQNLLRARIVVIFRGADPSRVRATARVMYEAGLRAFEITLDADVALDVIASLRADLPGDALVGAGTVLTPAQVADAERAGATYVISPNVDPAVISSTKERGLLSIPGAYTATEILHADHVGADMVKVFPLQPAGADYIRQIRGPVPDVKLMATGGVDAAVAEQCFSAGCAAVGSGYHLFGQGAAQRDDWDGVRADAQRFLQAGRLAPVNPTGSGQVA